MKVIWSSCHLHAHPQPTNQPTNQPTTPPTSTVPTVSSHLPHQLGGSIATEAPWKPGDVYKWWDGGGSGPSDSCWTKKTDVPLEVRINGDRINGLVIIYTYNWGYIGIITHLLPIKLGRKFPAKIEIGTESHQTPVQEVVDISLLDTQVFVRGIPFSERPFVGDFLES